MLIEIVFDVQRGVFRDMESPPLGTTSVVRWESGRRWAVSLDAGDRARLRRIEAALTAADPRLAGEFRRWKPSSGPAPIGPGWTVVPAWVLVVFLLGFTTWMVAPAVGAAVAVYGCARIARRWAQDAHRRRQGASRGHDAR
jgi:Protein of unknown function (DUF3040)